MLQNSASQLRIHVGAKIWTIFTYLLCTLKGEHRHEGHTSIPLLHSLEQASQSVSNFPDPAVILSVILHHTMWCISALGFDCGYKRRENWAKVSVGVLNQYQL